MPGEVGNGSVQRLRHWGWGARGRLESEWCLKSGPVSGVHFERRIRGNVFVC